MSTHYQTDKWKKMRTLRNMLEKERKKERNCQNTGSSLENSRKASLPDGELNPGFPRDWRGYSPLYYRGLRISNRLIEHFFVFRHVFFLLACTKISFEGQEITSKRKTGLCNNFFFSLFLILQRISKACGYIFNTKISEINKQRFDIFKMSLSS